MDAVFSPTNTGDDMSAESLSDASPAAQAPEHTGAHCVVHWDSIQSRCRAREQTD